MRINALKAAGIIVLQLLAGCEQKKTTVETPTPAQAPTPGPAPAKDEGTTVIQYDCIPNYANWGGVTALYKQITGVTVPPDPKGSSVAMAALEKEKDNP